MDATSNDIVPPASFCHRGIVDWARETAGTAEAIASNNSFSTIEEVSFLEGDRSIDVPGCPKELDIAD
jgi:hypothetical protein